MGEGMLNDEQIGRIAHEANRAFCVTQGDNTQLPWGDAPDWQRSSAIEGVRKTRSGEITSPEQSHESWCAQKVSEGWVYGEFKSADDKTHPCLVPYYKLPEAQKAKDALYHAVVTTLLKL